MTEWEDCIAELATALNAPTHKKALGTLARQGGGPFFPAVSAIPGAR